MAESGHLNIGSQHSRGSRNNHVKSVQRLSLSTSSVSNSGSASDVGSTSGHFSVGQSDESNRSLMVPFNSDELDILRHNTNQFLSGSSSTMNEANNAPIATSSGAADMSADGAVFPNGQSSSGYVLNGVVDESGNVLFEAVEPEMGSQGQLFQSHLQSHHPQHDQQHAESSLHPPAPEMSSTRALDSQCLNLLNLHSTMSSAQSDTTTPNIVSSHPNFPGISVHSSTAAGLIQALSAVNRGMSNTQLDTSTSNVVSSNNNFPGISVQSSSAAGLIQALNAVNKEMTNPASFLPSSGRQPENSAASMEPTFNSALSDDPAGSTSNTAQVFLTQQHHQQHQILNIMLEGGTGASNTNIISNTPSVNLHHRRRESAIDYSRVAPGDNITSANINTGEEVMSSLGQRNSSIVTVSLDQQLSQHEEERQRHQQQQHEQQQHLWIHQPNQGRVMSVQDAVSRDLGICQLPTAVDDTAPQATQQEAQLSEVSGNFQPLGSHLGNNRDNRDFHDMQSQLSGIFNQQQQSAFHVTTASSSSFGPASPGEQPHPYAVIGADSEAAPSDPGLSQQQHVIVENRTVDSSCLQPGFTLVFDTGSQTLQIQRMTSPSDCTVSQSILSMEGSEAQASPSPAHFSSKNYSQPQVNQSLSTNFTCGNSSQEVTTSTMPPQLRHISDRAGLSRVDSICNRRQAESSANSTSTLASVVLKIEKPEADGVAECDTTQEDIEGFEHQSPATSSNIGESQDELHSTVLQPAIQRSEAISPVEVTMDTTLECNNLTSFQSVAIEASRDVMQPGASSGCLSSGVPTSCKEPQSGQLATLLTDTASLVATTAKQPQSVRKSRRLELVAQESKVSLKKRNYKSKQYDPAMLWCEDCMDAFSDQCPMHRLTAVPDRIVLSRAWASCPNQIQICRLPEAQLAPEESSVGVFAKRQIPKFTQFGPFLGVLVDALDRVTRQFFPLMLDMPNKHRQYFETADENQCNWMMFVRPARTFAEQNLVAYQHKRNVFFSSTKIIEPKQELKVWYAAPYAEQMGVKTLELTEDDIQALDEADGRFACSECSRRFRSWAALQRHLFTHDEEESEEEIREEKLAQLQEYVNAETDGDTDFVPGFKESSDRQLSSRAAVQQRIKGTSKRGRFKHGRKRLNVGEGNRKKTTFLAKTLKKYKRAQNPRPCSDSVLQTMKGMYRRRGKLSGGNEWMCTHCGLTFDNASLLNLHTLTHAAEDVGMEEIRKLAIPQTIEFSSDVPASLTAVLPSDSPGRTSAADTTLQPLLPVSTNLNTAEVEGKPLNVACPKCNVVFNDHKDLMDHVSTHAQKPQGKDGRPFCCGHCSKSFSTTEKLARHQMVHGDESEKPLECPVCSKRVMTNSAMACHMKTHSNRKYFDCPICDTDFNTVAGLREHAQISHADQNGHYPCKECAKVFEDFALLKKHVRAFHSNKTFQCQECSKVFPRLDKLRLHMLRHTSHREFMCETCGRQFKRKDKLREHMKRVHDGRERQNQQGVVGGAVVEEQQVVTTTKFTPKVMPSEYHRFIYKCHTCLLGFKRRGMLVNHLAKRHPEIRLEQVPELNLPILKTQKDFYCQYCEKIYKSASKRKMHIQKSHPGCAVPPSSRKKLSSLGDSGDACPGVSSLANGFNNSSFSHTVSSITTMPHGCKFCHKQYASKTKLIQHQRKQHPDIAEPQNISRRKIKKTESDILQIAVGGEERYEPVLPITVVNQGGDATNLQATDLLNLAMSELNYSGASGVASLASLISSLGGGATAATPAGGGGAMVHIQSNTGQLQPATIDLSQLNQALQTFSVTGQGPAQAGLTTVLQTPLSPNQHQHHQQQQQQLHQHQQQIQLQQHQIHPQQQQQLTVVTPSGSQTINLSNGGQFIARAWPANFATQAFR